MRHFSLLALPISVAQPVPSGVAGRRHWEELWRIREACIAALSE